MCFTGRTSYFLQVGGRCILLDHSSQGRGINHSSQGRNKPLPHYLLAQVDVDKILNVRDALLNAGTNLWQPLSLKRGSMKRAGPLGQTLGGGGGDEEVNQALEQLLLGNDRSMNVRVGSCLGIAHFVMNLGQVSHDVTLPAP